MNVPLPMLEALKESGRKTRVEYPVMMAYLTGIPASWSMTLKSEDTPEFGALCAAFQRGGIQALVSLSKEEDGNIWVHVSCCGRTGATRYHMPTFDDLKRVKTDFLGDRWAYQVFPNEKNYINQHPYVLHLYARLDGAPALPDFTHGLGTI